MEVTHIVEEDATLVHRHVVDVNDCTCFSQRLWEGRSEEIKALLCVLIIKRSTVHLVRVRVEFLYCSIFSNSRKFQLAEVMAEACYLVSLVDNVWRTS